MGSPQDYRRRLGEMVAKSDMFGILKNDEDRLEACAMLQDCFWPSYSARMNVGENDFLEYLRALRNGEAGNMEEFFMSQDAIVGEAQDVISGEMLDDARKAVRRLAGSNPELAASWKEKTEGIDVQEEMAERLVGELRDFGVVREDIGFESDNFRCDICIGQGWDDEWIEGEEKDAIGALSELYRDGKQIRPGLAEPLSRSGLAFLLESQGYSFQDLMGDRESPFLQSVRMELGENSYEASATIALRLNIHNAADLFGENGMILLPRYGGLFNCMGGSGGIFEIEFEKPVHLNGRMISDFHVEKAAGNHGYSIDEVYGMTDIVWNCRMKKAEEPPRPFMGIPVDGVAFQAEAPAL